MTERNPVRIEDIGYTNIQREENNTCLNKELVVSQLNFYAFHLCQYNKNPKRIEH